MKVEFASLLAFVCLSNSIHPSVGAPTATNQKGSLQVNAHPQQSHGLPIRPHSLHELIRIPVKDFHKVNHEEHLMNLNDLDLSIAAQPLLGAASDLIKARRFAKMNLQAHQGEVGKLYSGDSSGNVEAHKHHMWYIGAQRGLNHLNAPLEAVRHAAEKLGNDRIKERAKLQLQSIPPNLDPKQEWHTGRKLYHIAVGEKTPYFRKHPSRED